MQTRIAPTRPHSGVLQLPHDERSGRTRSRPQVIGKPRTDATHRGGEPLGEIGRCHPPDATPGRPHEQRARQQQERLVTSQGTAAPKRRR